MGTNCAPLDTDLFLFAYEREFLQTKHLGVLIHIWTKGGVGAPLNRLEPSSKIFYWPFQGGASFVDHLCYFCLVLLCFHARLFVDAFGHQLGKG